jgi:hypothetical protein
MGKRPEWIFSKGRNPNGLKTYEELFNIPGYK